MRQVRLLAAGDSPAFRRALAAALAAEPRLELVGEAPNSVSAVAMARERSPDLVLIDLLLPRLGGVAATTEILSRCPARVMLLASEGKEPGPELKAKSMLAGALLVLAKPAPGQLSALESWARAFGDAALRTAAIPLMARRGVDRLPPRRNLEALALVASTGGPPVLAMILDGFAPELPMPVLVAQHVAHGFSTGMAQWLGESTGLRVAIAADGEPMMPGMVYLAPEGHGLEIGLGRRLATPKAEDGFGPSGDRLLESMARQLGPRSAAAVLTGMGRDGAEGLLALAQAGGITMVQDKSSCTVHGMPEAAATLCAAHHVLSPQGIHCFIREACNEFSAAIHA